MCYSVNPQHYTEYVRMYNLSVVWNFNTAFYHGLYSLSMDYTLAINIATASFKLYNHLQSRYMVKSSWWMQLIWNETHVMEYNIGHCKLVLPSKILSCDIIDTYLPVQKVSIVHARESERSLHINNFAPVCLRVLRFFSLCPCVSQAAPHEISPS